MSTFSKYFIPLAASLLALTLRATAADLPRVLILGDDLYIQAAAELGKELKGAATVVHPKLPDDQPPTTTSALASMDKILGTQKWDVIHFNFGLADLTHHAPGMKSFRVLPKSAGGVIAVSPGDYEKNLDAIVRRLAQTGARLIWASTPPITPAKHSLFTPGDEIEYNRRAAAVMARHRIPVNELHAYVTGQLPALKNRVPETYALPSVIPFHPPILELIRPLLAAKRT